MSAMDDKGTLALVTRVGIVCMSVLMHHDTGNVHYAVYVVFESIWQFQRSATVLHTQVLCSDA
jgi:hypothetical protein